MSSLAATQIPKPKDEQAFERACVKLFCEILNDPNVQTHGRRGQEQKGVDLYGYRDQQAERLVGIQCKLKGDGLDLSEKEVRDEVAAALTFNPPLREYIIVTTAPDDQKLQRVVRELIHAAAESGRQIAISVWGWQTLEQRISEHGAAMQAFDPTYGPFAQQHTEQLSKVGEQQSVVVREIASVRHEIGTLLNTGNLPGGSTVVQDALESALDAEIDQYRDILRDGKPKTALGLYHALLARVQGTASSRIIFRIKANIGHCQMVLGDNVRAAHWLLEAFAHAPKEPKALANKALAMLLQNRFKEAYEFAYSELRKDPTNQWLAPYLI